MKYIRQFVIILFISFIGEVLKYVLPLPIPASIYGLVLMFILLETKVLKVEAVQDAGKFLIEIMPMMFIPAGVGLLNAWDKVKTSVGSGYRDHVYLNDRSYGNIRKSNTDDD